MKKILFLILILPLSLFSQSYLVSDIPLPKTYIMDLDPYECNEECMHELLENEMIFSFLAHAHQKLQDKELNEARLIYTSVLNMGRISSNGVFRVALLLPYTKIGRYATSTTNAVFAYLMAKNSPFTMKSYKIEDENTPTLEAALQQIQNDGIDFIIAPLTHQGVENVLALDPYTTIYFPTENSKNVLSNSSYFVFGGIDYQAQSDLLLQEAHSPLVIFSDTSTTGKKLATYQESNFLHPRMEDVEPSAFSQEHEVPLQEEDANLTDKEVFKYFISSRTTNLEHYLKDKEEIINASFMINTPIIKTGMIMSQITLYDLNATNTLSTQINYNPLLLSMTQYRDRKDMVVTNSITLHDNIQTEINSLLGNDIEYDWINYSTVIGVDYFYSQMTGEARVYELPIEANQVQYDIELMRPLRTRFVRY